MGPDARKAYVLRNGNGEGRDLLYVKPDCKCKRVCSLQLYKCPEGQFKWNGDAKKPDVQGSVGYHKPGGRECGCHFFIRNGEAVFCADSGRHAGETRALLSVEFYYLAQEERERREKEQAA